MTAVNETKHISVATNESKNDSTPFNYLRHGKDPKMSTVENYTPQQVVFEDGKILESVTFTELADQVDTNLTKH